jgi:type II secretory ATPase GspE/PulE/Tfp pilus assembly ATPase PilB-like protein
MENSNLTVSREKKLELQLRFQKRLQFITNKINSAKDTDDILLNLQEEILSLFDADRITIYIVDGVRKEIVSRFKTGNEVSEIRVPITKQSIAGYCALSGKVVNIADAYDENELAGINPELRFDRNWDQRSGYMTKQVLAVPIVHKYRLGVAQLINKKNGTRFTAEDASSLLEITRVLGIAFFNNHRAARRKRSAKFDYLVSNNIITGEDLEQAMLTARKARKPVEKVLMSHHRVPKEEVGRALAQHYKTRFIPYDERMVVPTRLLKGLRPDFLKTNGFVPVAQSDGTVVLAMENPDFLPARDTVNRLIPGQEFEYCVALREDVFRMIDRFFGVQRTQVLGGARSIEDILGQLQAVEEEVDEETAQVSEEDGAIVQLVNKMIMDAYDQKASDIHLEPRPGKENTVIRFRIDGVCREYQRVPYTFKHAVVARIKIMSDLDISERRRPQDGRIRFKKYAPLDIELRVATIPTAGGNQDVVIRILPSGEPMPLDKLGMSARDREAFGDMIGKPYGIVLVVGPTGSGKTTTLHAALRHINRLETKIWTAEDPVEITQGGLRQVQVQPKIGFDFATAMRSFLRADPDVIMVGEMRDQETLATGIEASLTGHLVLTTLHTNSAPETITRMLDMGMDPFNFADALLGILAQRLVRTLCRACKEAYHPPRTEYDTLLRAYNGRLADLGFPYNPDLMLYRSKGCPECGNTGYRGRTGLHEVLVGTDDMKRLIQGRAKMEELRGLAIKEGMTTLMQDGIRKVFLGLTDLAQVRKVCIR